MVVKYASTSAGAVVMTAAATKATATSATVPIRKVQNHGACTMLKGMGVTNNSWKDPNELKDYLIQ